MRLRISFLRRPGPIVRDSRRRRRSGRGAIAAGDALLAGDRCYRGRDTSGAYRLIVHGTNARVDGSIKLAGSKDTAGSCKSGTGKSAKIVVQENALFVYDFQGGKPERRIDGPFTLDGAAIGQAGR